MPFTAHPITIPLALATGAIAGISFILFHDALRVRHTFSGLRKPTAKERR